MSYTAVKRNGESALADLLELLVDGDDDLPDAAEMKLAPGSIAYTADLANIWMLDINRVWQPIGE